jgi:hypothetical protein
MYSNFMSLSRFPLTTELVEGSPKVMVLVCISPATACCLHASVWCLHAPAWCLHALAWCLCALAWCLHALAWCLHALVWYLHAPASFLHDTCVHLFSVCVHLHGSCPCLLPMVSKVPTPSSSFLVIENRCPMWSNLIALFLWTTIPLLCQTVGGMLRHVSQSQSRSPSFASCETLTLHPISHSIDLQQSGTSESYLSTLLAWQLWYAASFQNFHGELNTLCTPKCTHNDCSCKLAGTCCGTVSPKKQNCIQRCKKIAQGMYLTSRIMISRIYMLAYYW